MHLCLISPDRHYELTPRSPTTYRLDLFKVIRASHFVTFFFFVFFLQGAHGLSRCMTSFLGCFIDIDNTPNVSNAFFLLFISRFTWGCPWWYLYMITFQF